VSQLHLDAADTAIVDVLGARQCPGEDRDAVVPWRDVPHSGDVRAQLKPAMEERDFFTETRATKPIDLVCTFCRTRNSYELPWVVRKKKGAPPRGADERDRAKFAKMQSYMVLAQDKVACKNMRCRKMFDVSGTKTLAFLTD
jgi:hypothetical protein